VTAKWVKGQSGNPRGRPLRGRSVAELARLIAQEKVAFDDDGELTVCSRLERLLRVLWTMSLEGDLRAMRCLLEYMEGRPVQVVAATVARVDGGALSEAEVRELSAFVERRLLEWQEEMRLWLAAGAGSAGTGAAGPQQS
jgi:hypothetical protein